MRSVARIERDFHEINDPKLRRLLKYDPSTGIYGMDFYVVMKRAGARVGRRKLRKARVGFRQRMTKQDSITWFEKEWTEDFAKVLN